MKSKELRELRRLDDSLMERSWLTYQEFLGSMLGNIDTDIGRECLAAFHQRDWAALVDIADRLASTEFRTPAEHRLYGQVAAVIRKYPFPDGLLPYDPEGKALESFLAAEHLCRRVNQRFSAYRKVRCPISRELAVARSYISHVLGELNLSEVWESCNFGAGASLGIHGNATNAARKLLSKRWTVTPGAYYYARAALKKDLCVFELLTKRENTPFFSLDPDFFNEEYGRRACVVDNNKIAFVPKTVKVHRTIAVEPLLNGYLQKGVDVVLRKRLLRVGIDLRDQEQNKIWARKGSKDHLLPEAYATIDLSSASDSISIELCRELLPPDWFDFLNSIRSGCYELNGKVLPYHKFTTMGNGFCFPLETLIFASLCVASSAMCHRAPEFLVYGDDIIVRKPIFSTLVHLLGRCGFKVNPKKTFSSGPFRESCGADWFEGEDVRPIILDYRFDSLESIFKFCNMARSKDSIAAILGESLNVLEQLIPSTLKFVRPYKGNADSCLEVPWDVFMASPFARYSQKLQCWSWVELMTTSMPDVSVKRFAGYDVALMRGALTGVSSSTPYSLRFTSRTKICRRSYAGGYSILGPGSFTRSWVAEHLRLRRHIVPLP